MGMPGRKLFRGWHPPFFHPPELHCWRKVTMVGQQVWVCLLKTTVSRTALSHFGNVTCPLIYLFIFFNGQAYFLQGNFVQLVNSVSSSHAAASATKLVLQGSPRKPSSMGFQSLQLNSNVTVTQQSACICSSDSAVVQQPHSYQLQLLYWVLASWDLHSLYVSFGIYRQPVCSSHLDSFLICER